MPLEITWSRRAMRLPEEVREEVRRRLERLHRYFPEMKTQLKVGITRHYDGLAFQSFSGSVKLMLDVHRRRNGEWEYPTYWTMAHELMHLAQFNSCGIPGGERACDIYALSRLPPSLIDEAPSYVTVPEAAEDDWNGRHARLSHQLAKKAIQNRKNGMRRYAKWWEREFEERSTVGRGRRAARVSAK
jgi:hypothetical protein